MKFLKLFFLVVSFFSVLSNSDVFPVSYTFRLLDDITYYNNNAAGSGVSENGYATGDTATLIGLLVRQRAFRYDPFSNTIKELGIIARFHSYGIDVNSKGDVVGYAETADLNYHAFLYTDETGMQDLGTLGGEESRANGINNLRQVVGWSYDSNGNTRAFISEGGGPMRQLQVWSGRSVATDINNSGQIVGQGWNGTANHAFFYEEDPSTGEIKILDLGTLYRTTSDSSATAVSQSGEFIVGSSEHPSYRTHAFLYVRSADTGEIIDLGTLGGSFLYSYARGVNNSGQVVGDSKTSTNHSHAFLYEDGEMIDLNDLTIFGAENFEFTTAADINDLGWIVGTGKYPGGLPRPYLLIVDPNDNNAVPEPATIILLIAGFFANRIHFAKKIKCFSE